jgi:signal transduction histidine kinase
MLAAIALNFAFKQILLDQAKLRITATSDQIVQTIDAETAGFFEEQPVVTLLGDRMTLDHWAGPTTYIQIDELNGYPIGKSSNMGSLRIPPHLDFHGTDESFEIDDDPDGGQLLVLDRLLIVNDRPAAIAHVAERLDIVRLLVRRARTILIASTIAGALVVIAASFFIARTAIDPIVRLTAAISEIGSDRLDRRIAATSEDEVGQLAGAFNAMLARLQEAFARERQFISDASHELKTPLTVINANAQLLKRWGDRDPVVLSESLDAIANESAQLAGMVSGMLTLAKADSGDAVPREPLLLGRLAAEVVAHAHDRAALKGLALTFSGSSDGPIVEGDESLLRQMINNLVDNAMKFTESGGIDVTVTANKSEATIDVADTGVGIEPEVADRLFDRFFRSDASHSRIIEGTGLGLAIVRSIARVHGGTVSAAPRPGGGSVFRVILPVLDASFTDPQ